MATTKEQLRAEIDELRHRIDGERQSRIAATKKKAIEAAARALAPHVAAGVAGDVAELLAARGVLTIDEDTGTATINGMPLDEGAKAWAKTDAAKTWRADASTPVARSAADKFAAKFGETPEQVLGLAPSTASPAAAGKPAANASKDPAAKFRERFGADPATILSRG